MLLLPLQIMSKLLDPPKLHLHSPLPLSLPQPAYILPPHWETPPIPAMQTASGSEHSPTLDTEFLSPTLCYSMPLPDFWFRFHLPSLPQIAHNQSPHVIFPSPEPFTTPFSQNIYTDQISDLVLTSTRGYFVKLITVPNWPANPGSKDQL